MTEKVINTIVSVWEFLDGKKRRIALVASAVALVVPSHTLAYKVAVVTGAIFGIADGSQAVKTKIRQLPEGIRK